jgi:hypothetical protein
MSKSPLLASFLIVLGVGCAADAEVTVALDPDGSSATDGKADGTGGLRHCVSTPFTAPRPTGFTYTSNRLLSYLAAHHYAQDVIGTPKGAVDVVGWFRYGPTNKDLEQETVSAFIDTCGRWFPLGNRVTDRDGAARWSVDVELPPGEYHVRFLANGDATQAVSTLWVYPVGTHLAVTDIDGTMTTSDSEVWKEIALGSYVPQAYPHAADLTKAHVDRKYVMVYLSGRPTWLVDPTRAWLKTGGFASGPVHVCNADSEAVPRDSGVGDFKAGWLSELEAQGFIIDFAYGNATTDVYGYAKAGIAADHTWIIGPNAGAGGTHGVTDTWGPRVDEVAKLPAAKQPF